jgi:hypothetical protein
MKIIGFLIVFFICSLGSSAQKLSKADKKMAANLVRHIELLASDSLEGRSAGSEGERKAAEYIIAAFRKVGLKPAFSNENYLQPFLISEKKYILPENFLKSGGQTLRLHEDYFPLDFSAQKEFSVSGSPSLHESGSAWFSSVTDLVEKNKNNPHFDLYEGLLEEAQGAEKRGASAVFFFGYSGDSLSFIQTAKRQPVGIPVLYITQKGMTRSFSDPTEYYSAEGLVRWVVKQRTGNNVAAFINNNARFTAVIGAHYDHLGFGEDNNSLHTGKEPVIHNGADDNASGTAAMLELAAMIKAKGLKKYNYLFVAFSGEELGLFGSKFFTENPPVNIGDISYMINMDMLGRLNDSSRLLTVGGYGTSPSWSSLLSEPGQYLKLRFDSSGTGPSDHTSFYRKDIPVLFFFTGLHSDYHKPSDDAEKINLRGQTEVVKLIYRVISRAEDGEKLAFTRTRETIMSSKTSFRVTLGIMPDYTFSGPGVRADGISDNKPAQKAGLIAGDIILRIGDYRCGDIQAYMEALSKFKKGDETTVEVLRGSETLRFNIAF